MLSPLDWLRWARSADAGSAPSKAILYSLVSYADPGGRCWPSAATLASDACLSVRAARYALRRLSVAGLIRIESRSGRSSVFVLTPARGATLARGAPLHEVPPPLHEVQGTPARGAAELAKELTTEENSSGSDPSDRVETETEVDTWTRAVDAWSSIHPASGARLKRSKGLGRMLATRIRSEGLEDVLRVFRWYGWAPVDDRWGSDLPEYLRRRKDLGTLLRPKNFDRYAGFAACWRSAGAPRMALQGSDVGQEAARGGAAAWASISALPGWLNPSRGPARVWGSAGRWFLADTEAEHDRRFAALDAVGGWPARCQIKAGPAGSWDRKNFSEGWILAYDARSREAA